MHNHTHPHNHRHSDHGHSHGQAHTHNHTDSSRLSSRRDFMRVLMGGALAGVSVIELAYHRAAWARAALPDSGPRLFDFEKSQRASTWHKPGPRP